MSSPYLAIRSLLQLVNYEGMHFPEASKLISFSYIDDILAGSSFLEFALCLQTELINLLKLGGSEVAKWASNEPHLLAYLHPSKCDITSHFSPDTDISLKLLGVYWDYRNDCFSYHTMSFNYQFIFLLVIFFAKRLMQELWKRDLDWDLEISSDLRNIWVSFASNITKLSNVKIPRKVLCNDHTGCDLIDFLDASEKGCAAVVYLRVANIYGDTKINLLTAKSMVAPLKQLFLPRLELCVALLLSKTIRFLLNSLA